MTGQSEVVSVIFAAAQSVAKVYLIGAVGCAAVRYPKAAPLLPASQVSMVARFSFHTLLLSLIFSTTAQSVSIDSMGQYWFVLSGAVAVMALSYIVATILGKWVMPIQDRQDFCALRIAATFPNIVALPILIFPSLCEHEVVYQNFIGLAGDPQQQQAADSRNAATLRHQCTTDANTMIFVYFFAWSLCFWLLGHPQLMAAAHAKEKESLDRQEEQSAVVAQQQQSATAESAAKESTEDASSTRKISNMDGSSALTTTELTVATTTELSSSMTLVETEKTKETTRQSPPLGGSDFDNGGAVVVGGGGGAGAAKPTMEVIEADRGSSSSTHLAAAAAPTTHISTDPSLMTTTTTTTTTTPAVPVASPLPTWQHTIRAALYQTFTSPGFVAMLVGIVVGLIAPFRDALFRPAGALRFLGDALETMGNASTPLTTMVVAASLMPPVAATSSTNVETTSSTLVAAARGDHDDDHYDQNDDNDVENRNHHDANHHHHTLAPPTHRVIHEESPIMSDPTFRPHVVRQPLRRRSSLYRWSSTQARRMSKSWRERYPPEHAPQQPAEHGAMHRSPEQTRLLLWFTLSRLIITPALMLLLTAWMLRYGWLDSVPRLSLLVVMVNATLPGALIVVVLLKAQECLARSAAAVAAVYLPTYLLSIVTIAAWTAVGMYIAMP